MAAKKDQKTNDVHEASKATLSLIAAAEQAWTKVRTDEDSFVVAAAKATFAAHAEGLIGKGQRFENSTAYGLLFKDRDGNGASKSTITRWRRLGAYLNAGGDPTSQTWSRLVSKANDPRLGSVLDSDKVTANKVETAVRKVFPRGKYAPATKPETTAPGEGNGNTKPHAEKVTIPNGVPGMLDMLEMIAARMEGKAVTPAESERLAGILARFETVTVAPVETVEAARTA